MAGKASSQRLPEFPVLIREGQIRAKVAELARRILAEHPGKEDMLIVGVLKGSLVFVGDLVRHLSCPLEIELVRAASYDGDRPAEGVRIGKGLSALEVAGKHVLLVDTILDTGRTLRTLHDFVLTRGAASVKTCVLIEKRGAHEIEPDYTGFTIDDVFVVGYGLDYRNRWRHLPYVAKLPDQFLESS